MSCYFFILHVAISLGFQLLLGTDKGNVFTSTMDTDVGKICEIIFWSTMAARNRKAVLAWNEFRAVDVRSPLTVKLMPTDCCRYKKTEHTSKIIFRITATLDHNEKDCGDNKVNFLEILDNVASNSKDLKIKLDHRYGNYSSPESQNNMIIVIGEKVKQINK